MKIPLALALASACAVVPRLSAPARGAFPEPAGSALVSYSIAPGESGAPVETIAVGRRGASRTLTLSRKSRDRGAEAETAELTAAEFDAVWAAVTRDGLLAFEPEEVPGKVFDYGERVFRTEVRPSEADPATVRVRRWVRPIANGARLEPVVKAMSALAHAHAKALRLEYFAAPPAP